MSLYVKLEAVSKVFPIGYSATGELLNAINGDVDRKNSVNSKVAVNEITLTLNEGDRLGIVGRNGAGKSSLLHMIAGISEPTSGKIHINGKVTSIMTLGIGLRDDLSGRENIYVDGEIQGKSRAEIEKIIEEVIDFAELGKFIDYPIRTYSTGMKARLAFSMITHISPEILIIDEALSVGDASFAAKATSRIIEICAKGKIVILVSHSMKSVRDICNRCIYLKDGSVVLDGSPVEVTNAYIDEVRGEDEAELIKKFASHEGNWTFAEGYAIENPVMLTGEAKIRAARIEVGQRVIIQIAAQKPFIDLNSICRVCILRLDGVVFFREDFSTEVYLKKLEDSCLELEFSPLLIGPSIYRLDVELRDNSELGQVYARSSSIFEVYSLLPMVGGRPMLYYPITLKAGFT